MATVIFKPTLNCNSRCVYCDVVHRESPAVKTMPEDILETFFIRINEYLLDCPEEEMEIIWHGGEPLILGPKYFETALGFQERHCSETSSRIRHAIQSNLTLLTPGLISVLKKLGINSIGSSYDPFSNLRGLGKKVDAEEYRQRFMDGVELLRKEGMGWGIIYVVTKLSLEKPLDIFHHLTNFCIGGAINLNPVIIYDDRLDYLKITSEEFTDFLGAIFPVWWRNRLRYPHVSPFTSLVRNLMEGDRKLSCGDSGLCAYTHINLSPDGRISQCGRSSDWNLLDYGTIQDKTFSEVFADPQRKMLLDRNSILSEGECKGCRFWDICHGGCPLDSWYETGSFVHKSFMCGTKKDFIERYVEPVIYGNPNGKSGHLQEKTRNGSESRSAISPGNPVPETPAGAASPGQSGKYLNEILWINPVGGLGDTLMLSGILKHLADQDRSKKFKLVRRTKYNLILEGHPAIDHIGYPPPGAKFITTDYWNDPDYSKGQRAYQILARMFGLKTPIEERLYVPWPIEYDATLMNFIPLGRQNVIICPNSDSPRKQAGVDKWEALVEMLRASGVFVIQVGKHTDSYVRGAYNLLGLTTIRQLVSLLSRVDAVITSDNFVMHASHLCNIPAVVLWGPTKHYVYGYEEQVHFQINPECASSGCIGVGNSHLYGTHCPEPVHCMDQFNREEVYRSVLNILREEKANCIIGVADHASAQKQKDAPEQEKN